MYDETNQAVPAPPPAPPPVSARGIGLSRRAGTIVTSVGLLAGGILGGYIVGQPATTTTAATSTPAPSSSGSTGTAPAAGAFHPNEDPTHEAGESAQREAQENAGQVPTVR